MKIFGLKVMHGVLIISCLCVSIIALIIAREYNALKTQIQEMLHVREEYQNYVLALKRLISDYQKQLALEESPLTSEKKKLNEEQTEYVFVNRDNNYLKKSALSFAQMHNIREAVAQLYTSDDFVAKTQIKKPRARKKTRNSHYKSSKQNAEINPAWWETLKKEPIFECPIAKGDFWLSSRFGPRKKPDGSLGFHHGIDMAAVKGTLVKAAQDGVVIEAGYVQGYGNTIVIVHNRKFKTRYAHLARIKTTVGAKVIKGTVIGTVGDTGFVRKRGRDASHLHFEVSVFGKRVNPLYFLA